MLGEVTGGDENVVVRFCYMNHFLTVNTKEEERGYGWDLHQPLIRPKLLPVIGIIFFLHLHPHFQVSQVCWRVSFALRYFSALTHAMQHRCPIHLLQTG
jgi:hypothetical protein